MFSFFSKNKKILGLDISEDRIRYAAVLKSKNKNKLLCFGEEKIAGVEPRNALFYILSDIKRKTNIKNAIVALPEDVVRFEIIGISKKIQSFEIPENIKLKLTENRLISRGESVLFYEKLEALGGQVFYKVSISSEEDTTFIRSVFVNSGINVLNFVSRKDALLASCLRPDLLIPSMVLNLEKDFTNIALYFPFEDVDAVTVSLDRVSTIKYIKDVSVDFYKDFGEKIEYVFATGPLAEDARFLNSISRETRLPIDEANPLTNLHFKKGEVPFITQKESLVYAVAIGLAIY